MPVNVAVVGLGFGAAFVPIYQCHPDVGRVVICDSDPARLTRVVDECPGVETAESLETLLGDSGIDAVHLLTPLPTHVDGSLAILASGRHCACAVVMATNIDDLCRVIDAEDHASRNYMMMETAVYSREFLYAQDLAAQGAFGPFTFFRGSYFQDLEGDFPAYWRGVPPMHYSTHVVAPILALTGGRATSVACFGAGRLRNDLQLPGGNEFPLETGLFRLSGTQAVAEVTRSWFQTARSYTEAFSAYGERMGFEWQQLEHEDPVVYRLAEERPAHRRDAEAERIQVPFRPDLLPPELASFASGGHGGSHPHLVHEFVRSIVEGRRPKIDARTAATWTAPGICAHLSACRGGEIVEIPDFS